MRVGQALRAAATSAGVVLFASCGGDDDPQPTPTGTSTLAIETTGPSPVVPTPSPPPIAAGMAQTIRAIESAAEVEILERIVLSEIPCAADSWPQPACPPGQPDGTRVPRLPFLGCEPVYLTPDDLRIVIRQVISGRMPSLFAAANVAGPGSAGAFPLGPYALVFRTIPPLGVSADSAVLAVLDNEGRIISLRTGCRATPEQLLQQLPGAQVIESPRAGN